jgi:hypothetical protein
MEYVKFLIRCLSEVGGSSVSRLTGGYHYRNRQEERKEWKKKKKKSKTIMFRNVRKAHNLS